MKWLVLIFMAFWAVPAVAQDKPREYAEPAHVQEEPEPFRDPGRTLPYLAYTLGQLHYLAFACEGEDNQQWRDQMIALLRLEAPVSGVRRSRLIEAFNDGYQVEQQTRTRCGAEAEAQRRQLAQRGAQMSQAMLNEVLD
ncbi:TIGR02301 family protein [Hyphobacterium sp.]|uniref:TIGR02301 family protein n=1 Tax=Hyphobacterium sp. TaxID=2004662 RepID=UPI003BA8BA87